MINVQNKKIITVILPEEVEVKEYPNECGIYCGQLTKGTLLGIMKVSGNKQIREYCYDKIITLELQRAEHFDLVIGVKGKNAFKSM
jgi:hypothetical protein